VRVAAAEAKLRGEPADPAIVAAAVAGLVERAGPCLDTVVLACTHFPLLEDELRQAFGSEVQFIDGAAGIARRVAQLVEGQPLARNRPDFAVFTGAQVPPAALRGFGLDHAEAF
jgi:glutamate racemase